MIPVDDATALSRLFHLNSEPWLNETAYREAGYRQEFKDHRDAPRMPLPPASSGVVEQLAARRSSVRAFAPRSMPLQILADLLRAAYGIVEITSMETGGAFLRRSVPSAGGLYPLELYCLLRGIDGASDGIYHFDPRDDALECLSTDDWRGKGAEIFYTWPFASEANAIVCFSAVFERCQKKYGPRGYRYILLEAGHAAQNLCLAAVECRRATLCMGGFRDGALNRLLGLDVPREGVIYTVAVGTPS